MTRLLGWSAMQVRVRKRVGIVFEWLPNGSLEDLLVYLRPVPRSSARSARKQLTPKLAVECQASRWAASASGGVNGGANGAALSAARRKLPEDIANCPVSEILAMPCDTDAITALGYDWVRPMQTW